jgi:hypothetical protein
MIFESLPWLDGKVNPSGIKPVVFWIPKSEITTFPGITAAPANSTDNVSLSGDFALVALKKWRKLYSTQGKGKVSFEPIGEKDCKMFMVKGMFKFPDIDDLAKNLAKSALNANIVYVVMLPHESEKRYLVIGSDEYDVTTVAKGDSGDAPGSDKGLTVEVEAPATTPLPNFTGTLELEDGSLDCGTGVFTPSV